MSWTYIGFNARSTINFIDAAAEAAANETYVTGDGADTADEETLFPITRVGGTFGYLTDVTEVVSTRDRNASLHRSLAGVNFTVAGSPQTFRVNLDSAGVYNFRLASGDAYGARASGRVEVFDDATSKLIIDHATGFTSGATFRDATDTEYSAANWPGNNTAVPLTFASTICYVVWGSATRDGWFAHFSLERVTTRRWLRFGRH